MSQRRSLNAGQKLATISAELPVAAAEDRFPKFDLGQSYRMTHTENPDGSVDVTVTLEDGDMFDAQYDGARGAAPGQIKAGPDRRP